MDLQSAWSHDRFLTTVLPGSNFWQVVCTRMPSATEVNTVWHYRNLINQNKIYMHYTLNTPVSGTACVLSFGIRRCPEHRKYTVSQKKLWSRTLAITLSNLNRFQKFLHCCKEKKNFQQNVCNNSHHTLDMLLDYLVKYNNSKLTQITHKIQ